MSKYGEIRSRRIYAKPPAKPVFGNVEIVIPIDEMLGLLAAIREYQHRTCLVTRIQQPTFSLTVKGLLNTLVRTRLNARVSV
jgi:hypothetical protein